MALFSLDASYAWKGLVRRNKSRRWLAVDVGQALEGRAADFDWNRGRYLEPSVCGSAGHAALLTP